LVSTGLRKEKSRKPTKNVFAKAKFFLEKRAARVSVR